jgi:hypothetical protein
LQGEGVRQVAYDDFISSYHSKGFSWSDGDFHDNPHISDITGQVLLTACPFSPFNFQNEKKSYW